jgi:DNA helicase II / ATP-dependent DNA helicase PcrA
MIHYTDNQLEAIKHRKGNLLILACAGSGKTGVISIKIAQLISEGVKRDEIIAFTFTERAANELKTRVRLHLEELVPDNPSLGDMYIGTIHSFCLRMLKEIDPEMRKYEVMDEARQAALILTNYHYFPNSNKGIGLNILRSRTKTGSFWDALEAFTATLSIIYQQNISLNLLANDVRDALQRYQKIAYEFPNFFFDYDRIIQLLIEKLEYNPIELERIRSKFKYLFVDEYQDVDDQQEKLIKLITDSGGRVWVNAVGDDDQSIYGWRGARIKNILNFRRDYFLPDKVELTYNFRSTHSIVEIANHAIRQIPDDFRLPKPMEARHYNESSHKFDETMAEYGDVQLRKFDSEESEAYWIANRIKQLHGTLIREADGTERAINYADMAVLLRSVKSSGSIFVEVFEKEDIPFVVKGTGGLFDNDEVLLIQAAFCLLARSQYVIQNKNRNLQLDEPGIREYIREKIQELRKRGKMPNANEGVFLEWLASKREELDRRNLEKEKRGRFARRIYPQGIFQQILAQLGASQGNEPWPQDILFNLGRLSNLITQFESVHQWITPNDLPLLTNFLGGWAANQVDEGRIDETGIPDTVQILTVHGAKGLEWPVVFLPRISSANFPSNYRNRLPDTFLDNNLFDFSEYVTGDNGERRLWYVAITRCQKFLHITSPNRERKRPSAFFKEISHDYAQREGLIEDRLKGKPNQFGNLELLPTSFTDLGCYWRCPFEYQLRILMGFSPGVKEQYGYGQQIHNILSEMHECAIRGKQLSKEEVMELVETRFHLRYTRDGKDFKPFTALKNAAKLSLMRYLEKYPNSARYVLQSEKPFEYIDKTSKALISGTVDLLERIDQTNRGEVHVPVAIVDFKTHNWRNHDEFEKSKAAAESQLLLYSLAIGEALGYSVKQARVHFLSPKEIDSNIVGTDASEMIEMNVSTKNKEQTREEISNTIRKIRSSINKKKFELTGSKKHNCPTCDFRRICPGSNKWRETDKVTPTPPDIEDSFLHEVDYIEEDVNAGTTPE